MGFDKLEPCNEVVLLGGVLAGGIFGFAEDVRGVERGADQLARLVGSERAEDARAVRVLG